MGQARKRGTFEERKAQAIAAGRVKHSQKQVKPHAPVILMGLIAQALTDRRKK